MNDLGKTSLYRLTAVKSAREADGRKHRSQKSQTLIVNAMLQLVSQGNLEPSADQIAEIAKIGRRSLFRHFKDMDTLYREVSESIAASMISLIEQPFQATDWRGRVLELVDRRALCFEKLKPFLLAGQVHRHRSPFLKESHARFIALLRSILEGLLPPDVARDRDLIDTLDLLLSFESWHRLRDGQKLNVTTASRVLKGALESLLDARARHRPGQASAETRQR